MPQISRKRHLAKTLTWRFIATIDTILLGWFVTGNMSFGLKIGGLEVVTKMFLYYAHERAWYKFLDFGVRAQKKKNQELNSTG